MNFSEYKTEADFREANGYSVDASWYPRVTKIVEIKAKPALLRYYGEAASFKAAQEATKLSATEGTLIHETLEALLTGEHPLVDGSIVPAIQAAMEFINKEGVQVDARFVEKRLIHSDHRYAGTIDAVAIINGRMGILDIKTSQAIYRDYNLQTAAYMDILTKDLKDLTTRWIFRVDQIRTCDICKATLRVKGGIGKVRRPFSTTANFNQTICPPNAHRWGALTGICELKEMPEWRDDFQAFLGAKRLWEWENFDWLKKIGYLPKT